MFFNYVTSLSKIVITLFIFVILNEGNAKDVFRKEEHIRTTRETDISSQGQDPYIARQSDLMWNLTSTYVEELSQTLNNSCENIAYYTPDFRGEGRRVSEVKCLEHIWQIRYKTLKLEHNLRCGIPMVQKIIVGGDDAEVGQFPHMAAIGWEGAAYRSYVFKCGGVLISSKYVMTAAHCSRVSSRDTSVSDPSPKVVRFGARNILDVDKYGVPPREIRIAKFIVHDQYQSPKTYFDIALIELMYELDFTKRIHPSCIWTKNNEITGKASVAGWGVVETASRRTSAILQFATIDMLPSEECNASLAKRRNRNWNRGLASHQICAGFLAGGIDACQGDSGGPLQVKIDMPIDSTLEWKLYYTVGITSFGYGCANPNTPSVYSKVSHFIDWIEKIVWNSDQNATLTKNNF